VNLLRFFTRVQYPVEQQYVDSYGDVRSGRVVVATEPSRWNAEFQNGDVGIVDALDIELMLLEHEVYVFGHEFDMLEQSGELLAFFRGFD
jgi:hypothetical protein